MSLLLRGLVTDRDQPWGALATPEQVADADAILDVTGPRLHFLTRPRGASKTSDLAAVAIAVLVEQAPPGSRSYAVAVDADQGALLLDALRGLVTRTPGLSQALTVESLRVVVKSTGASLEVLPADGASAYGLRPYFVVADELAAWPSTRNARDVWAAVVSALPKVPGSRLVVLTSAGDPASWPYKVLERARRSSRWRVAEMPGPCPWIAADELDEQRGLLTESQYARLHLNQWTSPEDRLTSVDALRECVTLDGPQPPKTGAKYVIGLDVGLTNDRTVATVCHADGPRGGATVVLDRLEVWQGRRLAAVNLDAVESWVYEASRTYNRARVVFDPFSSVQLTQRLRGKGVACVEFTFTAQSVGKLGLTLYQLIREKRLALPDDEALLDELANVRLREATPGVVRLDHDAGRHDDRAVSLALAAHSLITASPGARITHAGRAAPPSGPQRPQGPPDVALGRLFGASSPWPWG